MNGEIQSRETKLFTVPDATVVPISADVNRQKWRSWPEFSNPHKIFAHHQKIIGLAGGEKFHFYFYSLPRAKVVPEVTGVPPLCLIWQTVYHASAEARPPNETFVFPIFPIRLFLN